MCTLAAAERAALAEEFARAGRELSGEPRVVCHRDYHSRNLMVHDGRLGVIDFQDARLGPDTYDLVSLLRDSYVELEPDRGRGAGCAVPDAGPGTAGLRRRRRRGFASASTRWPSSAT